MSRYLVLATALCLLLGAPAAGEPLRFTLADVQGYRPLFDYEAGEWIFFDLEPVTLRPLYKGPVKLRNFTVMGDFEEVEWQTAPGAPVRTFERVRRRSVDGETFSVFHLSFPATELAELGPPAIRFDQYHRSAAWPLRPRPAALPQAGVVRINDRVQYSSHVVNVVAPYTWAEDTPLSPGDRLPDPVEVVRIFYTYFSAGYEQLAMVPTRSHRWPVGSALLLGPEARGALRNATMHVRGDMVWGAHTLHETGHQWGFAFDLFAVAGAAPQVSTECISWRHMPLIADLNSFMSENCNLLSPEHGALCIRRDASGWVLRTCERPLSYHPLQLYAMGLMAREDVPPVYLRLRQDPITPLEPGRRVEGPFVEVTVDDVVAHYGDCPVRLPDGTCGGRPMPAVWRRAHIIVSPQRLLSPGHLAWFNFLAKRVSDPTVTGVEDVDGVPSMEFATRGMVDLRTDIRPLDHPKVAGRFAVTYPKIGRRDIVGLVLDKDLVTRYKIGRVHAVSGVVRSPGSYKRVRLEIGTRIVSGKIEAGRRFTVRFKLGPRDRGPSWMVFGLGESGPELGRIAPVYVE